jgi:hypothetical protein
LAAKNNIEVVESFPETITIVAEPNFGAAIKFVLFGAAIGAAGAHFLLARKAAGAAPTGATSALPEMSRTDDLNSRVKTLALRIKILASKTRDVSGVVSQRVKPALQTAIAEGRRAAQETREGIEHELATEPDTAYAAEGEELEKQREAEAAKSGL